MEASKLKDDRYEALTVAAQSAGVGVWEIDIATDTVRGTPQFFRIMGLEPTDKPVAMAILRGLRRSGDRERVNAGYTAAVATRADVYESEYRIRRPDGTERWILGRGRVIRDATGNPVGYSGADIDITDRKATEQALARSEARLRLAVEAADLGIWDWDLVSNEMTWSDKAKAIAGLPLGMPVTFEQIRDVTHAEDLPRTSQMAERALDPAIRSKEPYEYRIVRPDGSVRWVIAHGEAGFAEGDNGARAVRYTGTIQDITQRREMENELRESAARLKLAVDAARLAIWEFDSVSGTVSSSPELNRMLGMPVDRPLDLKAVENRYYPGELERLRDAGRAALAAGERYFQVEYRYLWPDESIRWLLLRAEILFSPGNVPSGALGVLMDITEEKRADEHRRLLLSELQHRVNNTLALVGAIANQTFPRDPDGAAAGPLSVFSQRLGALGQAHRILISQDWQSAELQQVVVAALKPYWVDDRFALSGPTVELPSRRALALALALNELATNAVKYGALSNATGRVTIAWTVDRESDAHRLHFRWSESGGPAVAEPRRTSFGTRLIRMTAADFGGEVDIAYPVSGVVVTLTASTP